MQNTPDSTGDVCNGVFLPPVGCLNASVPIL